jgi:hypothetical protein
MKLSGDYLVGTVERYEDPMEIPIVEHPEANENWISSQGDQMRQFKLIGIKMDRRTFSLVDFDPKNITEDDVKIYHAHSAYVEENGDLRSHRTVRGETDYVDGFLAAVNDEQLPLNEPLRVADLEGPVRHVLDALTSEIRRNYLPHTRQLSREDLPDGVEFQLKSHSTWNPEVEILDLGGLAREQLNRDFENFQDLYSRIELDADSYRDIRSKVRNWEVSDKHRNCAEMINAELETKEVEIQTPSEFFEWEFQRRLEEDFDHELPLGDDLRKRVRMVTFEDVPKKATYEVLCGVNWNGQ